MNATGKAASWKTNPKVTSQVSYFQASLEDFHIHPKLHIVYVTLSNNVTVLQDIPYVSWNDACSALETTAAEWHSVFEFKIFNLK